VSARCFVIMPIGDQEVGCEPVTASDLRKLYDDLIREALRKARPDLSIERADDLPSPGDITADIFERIADADYVVADITYPNPNVFYELGLRHASRAGTILLRNKAGPKPPFDISVLRHIEYENTATGLKELAKKLKAEFDYREAHPGRPDNRFLTTTEPRHALPSGGQPYQVLQIGKNGTPVWDWARAH